VVAELFRASHHALDLSEADLLACVRVRDGRLGGDRDLLVDARGSESDSRSVKRRARLLPKGSAEDVVR